MIWAGKTKSNIQRWSDLYQRPRDQLLLIIVCLQGRKQVDPKIYQLPFNKQRAI